MLRHQPRLPFLFLLLLLAIRPMAESRGEESLLMATTTSTRNSGLLDYLLPLYERKFGQRVRVIAVGTGKALRMGAAGDVELVIVHAPEAELSYMAKGAFDSRRALMHNSFVLLGAPEDKAGAEGAAGIAEALRKIARSKSVFISRGDQSGTHLKELQLWRAAELSPSGQWYQQAGQGMGQVLAIAGERGGYTLSDEATFVAYMNTRRLELRILSHPEPLLRNPYSVMTVAPKGFPGLNAAGANQLARWLVSPEGQKLIGAFRINGRQLFIPAHSGE